MRRAAKVDANQSAIARAAESLGATVQLLHAVGQGCPDLIIGWCGQNLLWEAKNKSGRGLRLTRPQEMWHARWKGQVQVIESPEHAIATLLEIQRLS